MVFTASVSSACASAMGIKLSRWNLLGASGRTTGMRKLLAVVVLGVLGALVLFSRTANDLPPQRPGTPIGEVSAAPTPVTDEPPLLQQKGARKVQPASPRSLKPIAKPIRLPFATGGQAGALSPDGRRAA